MHMTTLNSILCSSTEEEAKSPEPEWNPFIPETPSPILTALHSTDGEDKVWLSLGDFDAGYLYEAQFVPDDNKPLLPEDELYAPTRTAPVLGSSDVPITCMQITYVTLFSYNISYFRAELIL